MPTPHILSPRVGDALSIAIRDRNIVALADAFVEMYVQAMVCTHQGYAKGIDDIAESVLLGKTSG
jgi:hypothetical protein